MYSEAGTVFEENGPVWPVSALFNYIHVFFSAFKTVLVILILKKLFNVAILQLSLTDSSLLYF